MRGKKGCLVVGVLVLLALSVAGHQWALGRVEEEVRSAIFEETQFPPVVKGFRGFLPTGSFSIDYLEAKARVEENPLNVKSADITLRISPGRFLKEQYEIRKLTVESIQTTYQVPEKDLRIAARLELSGHSENPSPAGSPDGALWIEEFRAELDSLTLALGGKEWDLLHRANLEIDPVHLLPETGLSGKTGFSFRGDLTPSETENTLSVEGEYDSSEERVEFDAAINAFQFPSRVKWFDDWLKGEGWTAEDLIASGSLTFQVRGQLTGDIFSGEMTLRVLRPRFGKGLRELVADYPVEPLLNLMENRTDTLEIGPIEIEENLKTEQIESLPLLIGGLTREFFELNTGGGAGSLMEMFGAKKRPGRKR